MKVQLAATAADLPPLPPNIHCSTVPPPKKSAFATMTSASAVHSGTGISEDPGAAAVAVLEQVQTLEAKFKMDGSANFPHIIIADPNKDKCNWGFEVPLVTGIECRSHKRTTFQFVE